MPPLLPYAITLIAGILLQGSGISVFFMALPLGAAVMLILQHKPTASLFTLTLIFGYLIADMHALEPVNENLTVRELNYSAVVKEVREYESSRVIIARIDSCGDKPCLPFLTKLFIPSTLPVVDETERITFSSTLSHLISGTDIPGEADYNAPLLLKGVVTESSVQPDSLQVLEAEPGMLNSIIRYRQNIVKMIATTPLTSDTKTFLITTLTGDKSYLTPDTREIFSNTGIAHVLALSGMHVGILTWIIFIMLLPLQLAGLRKIRIAATITLLWLFAIVTGLSPSVVRAVTMATLLLMGSLMQRIHSPFNSLSFAAIAILIFTPSALYTIGFQLTFVAVIAILLIAKKINPFPPSKRLPYILTSYLTVTISAMLGTGIVSAYYFGIFPIYFLITNIITSLLLPLLLGGGAIITLLTAADISCGGLATVIDALYEAITGTASAIANLPGAYIDGVIIDPIVLSLYFIALAAFIVFLHKWRKVWILSAAVTLMTAMLTTFIARPVTYPDMLFIPKSSSETSVLIKDGDRLWMLTTAHRVTLPELREEYERKFNGFMTRCGIDSISLLPNGYISQHLSRCDNLLYYHGKNIVITNSIAHAHEYAQKIDYAIVCRGFSGDITELASIIKPDTLVLSSDIYKRRHNRYAEKLVTAGQKFKKLRESALLLKADRL